jgi:hypothetical protein
LERDLEVTQESLVEAEGELAKQKEKALKFE